MKKEYREERPLRALREGEMEFFKMRTVNRRAEAAHSHTHDALEIIYMNRGSVQVSIDGAKTSIYPGDLALFRSRSIHEIWTEDEVENDYFVLKLMPRILYNLSNQNEVDDFSLSFIGRTPSLKTIWRKEEIAGSDIELGLGRLIASLDKKKKTTAVYKIISALMVLEGLYSSGNSVNEKISLSADDLTYAVFYINSHYAEPISAEQIAEMISVSQSSFSRSFKALTNQSFKDYLNTVRTARAEELLKNTGLSVKEVAISVGYNNISHFISVYKRYKGKTPLEERK